MFENVTKGILQELTNPKGAMATQSKGGLYENAAKALLESSSLDTLFDALVALDGLVCAGIGAEMAKYQLDVPIYRQPDFSPGIRAQASFLLGAYRRVIDDPAAANAVTTCLGARASVFIPDPVSGHNDDRALKFLGAVRQLILLSLAVGKNGGASKTVFDRFADAKPVTIRIFYKQEASSFLAYVGDPKCYCKSVAQSVSPELRQRFANVVHDDGGPSDVAAPVWLDDPDLMPGVLLGKTFDHIGMDAALERIFTGSLSFTEHQEPYYTPPRIEILHELVHVLHNAGGVNREKANGMTNAEAGTWTNPEEYWTIAGDDISENHLNAQIGAPDRYGHSGLPLAFLAPTAEAAQYSLRQHATRQAAH